MTDSDLDLSVDGSVATITLNRPSRRNAFTLRMLDEWASALRAADDDDSVRVVVVTGAGGDFCSGVDLDHYRPGAAGSPWADRQVLSRRVHQVAMAMETVSKPVIAALRGVAFGAGMDAALMCDIRFAGDSLRMSQAYIRLGLLPGDGGCWYLPRIVGMSAALHLMWTGEEIDVTEAVRLGIVSRSFPDEELMVETYRYADQLAGMSPAAVQLIKRAAYQGRGHDLRTGLDLVASHMGVVAAMSDAREAQDALREHRTAVFEGR